MHSLLIHIGAIGNEHISGLSTTTKTSINKRRVSIGVDLIRIGALSEPLA